MPIARITPMGESGLYHIHVLDMVDPGFGGGRPGGVDPGWGQGHPGHHPDQGLPGGGHISNRPPGSGSGIPDNELPDHPPPQLAPGYTIVMVRGPTGKWEYAFIAPGSPPPRPLPPPTGGNRPDQGLPGGPPPTGPGDPNRPNQGLPGGPPPHPGNVVPGQPVIGGGPMPAPPNYPSGQPLPPTAQPR